jgi:branched-chain amino acid transport system ATP-binding protein
MASHISFLEVKQLEVVYDQIALAVQGVSLNVPEKRIVALLGPNGAGKTTTLRAISGFLGSDNAEIRDGTVEFLGERLNGLYPNQIARRGIILVPEQDKIFVTLTVEENLMAAVCREGEKRRREILKQVFHYFPLLHVRRRQTAGYLSGGERQMLAISKGLLCAPKLLMVDELCLGLSPLVINELMKSMVTLNKELGLALLLVEQNAPLALGIADYGYLLENGRVVLDGSRDTLLNHADVKEFYLGMGGDG